MREVVVYSLLHSSTITRIKGRQTVEFFDSQQTGDFTECENWILVRSNHWVLDRPYVTANLNLLSRKPNLSLIEKEFREEKKIMKENDRESSVSEIHRRAFGSFVFFRHLSRRQCRNGEKLHSINRHTRRICILCAQRYSLKLRVQFTFAIVQQYLLEQTCVPLPLRTMLLACIAHNLHSQIWKFVERRITGLKIT